MKVTIYGWSIRGLTPPTEGHGPMTDTTGEVRLGYLAAASHAAAQDAAVEEGT